MLPPPVCAAGVCLLPDGMAGSAGVLSEHILGSPAPHVRIATQALNWCRHVNDYEEIVSVVASVEMSSRYAVRPAMAFAVPLAVDPDGRKRLRQVESSGRGKSEIGEVDGRVLFCAEVYLLSAYFSALCQCCTIRQRNCWNDVSVLGWTFLSAGVAIQFSASSAAKARNTVCGITSEHMPEIIVGMRRQLV